MDEKQRSFRLVKIFLFFAAIGSSLFLAYAAYVYLSLPQIKDPNKCFTTSMYKINLCPTNASYVRYKQVPSHFFRALILAEDASFYSHKGLDWFEIKESFRRNFAEWKFARGGSTITQQLAKNLYLTKDKSINRKIKEFFIAKQIEKHLRKSQILEKYVNVVEFGPNVFGLHNAARHYFGKAVESLNVLESSYLVSLLPSPVRYSRSFDEHKLSKINISRMKIILGRLYRTKRIPDEVYVFCETLIDSHDWPFPHYANPFQDMVETIEDELMEELEMAEETEEQDYEEEVIKAVKDATEEQKENFEPIPEAQEEEPSKKEDSPSKGDDKTVEEPENTSGDSKTESEESQPKSLEEIKSEDNI